MKWHISHYDVTLTEEGGPTIALFATQRHVADVYFVAAPQRRFLVDFETGFVTLQLEPSERPGLMDLLRHERGVTLDTETPALRFER